MISLRYQNSSTISLSHLMMGEVFTQNGGRHAFFFKPKVLVTIVMKKRGKYNILVAKNAYHLCFAMDIFHYIDGCVSLLCRRCLSLYRRMFVKK